MVKEYFERLRQVELLGALLKIVERDRMKELGLGSEAGAADGGC